MPDPAGLPIPTPDNSNKPKQPLHKLGRFFRLRCESPLPSPLPLSRQETSGGSIPKHDAFDNYLSSVVIPSARISCPADRKNCNHSSDVTNVPDSRTRYRPLNHSISAPTMCTVHQSPSETSTRSPSPANGTIGSNPVMLSLCAHTMPAELDEKTAGAITVLSSSTSKSSAKPRWKWIRRRSDKSTVSIPSLPACSTLTPGFDIKKPPVQSAVVTTAAAETPPMWDATFEPTPPLSTIFPTSYEDLRLTPITSKDSAYSDDDDDDFDLEYREKPGQQKHRHRQSVNKLARTLGVLPHDFVKPAEIARLSTNPSASIGRLISPISTTCGKESSKGRRMSLSLTTNFNTSSSHLQTPLSEAQVTPTQSRSRASLSTLNTDDVHQLGLVDNLSETWGKVQERDGSQGSTPSSYSPISPITFKPPTPVTTVPPARYTSCSAFNFNPSRISTHSTSSADKLKLEEVTPTSLSYMSFASPASPPPPPKTTLNLNRSRSMPFTPLRIGRIAARLVSPPPVPGCPPHHHQHTDTPEHRSRTRAVETHDEPKPPSSVKANGLDMSIDEEAKARSFMVRHPEYEDDFRNWSGQWNQDDMQHVIRMLRALK